MFFDELVLAFWAFTNLRQTQSFLNLETSFILALLLHDFLTTKRDMRLFATILARYKETVSHRTFKEFLGFRYIRLVTAL